MNRKQTGQQGEDIATTYLLENQFTIITRNWRCRLGELDIVAKKDDKFIFVEVRTQRTGQFGTAAESITSAKQNRLIELAQSYLQEVEKTETSWQIDVITVQLRQSSVWVEHIENAVGW